MDGRLDPTVTGGGSGIGRSIAAELGDLATAVEADVAPEGDASYVSGQAIPVDGGYTAP